MRIKLLPPLQKYVNDNDVSVEGIQYERINEDLTDVNFYQLTEDRVVNSQVNSCFVIPCNQNKMKKETEKVTENRIKENRNKIEKDNQTFKEEKVINLHRENQKIVKENRRGEKQLIAPLGTRPEGRMLSDIRQICGVMTSHQNTSTLTYNNKKIKICWVWSRNLLSIISTSVIINIHGFTSKYIKEKERILLRDLLS